MNPISRSQTACFLNHKPAAKKPIHDTIKMSIGVFHALAVPKALSGLGKAKGVFKRLKSRV